MKTAALIALVAILVIPVLFAGCKHTDHSAETCSCEAGKAGGIPRVLDDGGGRSSGLDPIEVRMAVEANARNCAEEIARPDGPGIEPKRLEAGRRGSLPESVQACFKQSLLDFNPQNHDKLPARAARS